MIDYKTLFGSWAGAFGFSFMPQQLKIMLLISIMINILISKILMMHTLQQQIILIRWVKKSSHCFYKIELKDNIQKNI